MKDFRDVKVRRRAHKLVPKVYKVTKPFPFEKVYGLTSQTRRAASIPTNIAATKKELSGKLIGIRKMLTTSMKTVRKTAKH